jgi:RND family efflux transporter MFP subunit
MEPTESIRAGDVAATQHGEGEIFDPKEHRPTGRGLRWSLVGGSAVLVALLLVGIIPRVLHRSEMESDAKRAEGDLPRVRVARAARSVGASTLALPGSVQPLQETSVYARANGYVRRWLVDIGAEVKKGQVLVELEVPDIEEELRQAEAAANQARASIAQAKTQRDLADINNKRYDALAPSGVVTQQEVDQYHAGFEAQRSNVDAAEAALGSARANVRRLQDLKNFGVIVAPFDGFVTLRSAEVGQLVTAGTAMGAPLFKVAEVDVVRVFVNVPQLYASGRKVGMPAPTTVREMSGRTFPGRVARTAHELDTGTRTLLTEVDIANPDNTLVSGMYARVSFDVKQSDLLVFVPATAVLFDAQGTRAAVVRDGAIAWKKVEIDGDFGDRLAIATGIVEGDVVAAMPSDRLIEGMRVQVLEAKEPEGPKPIAEGKAKSP